VYSGNDGDGVERDDDNDNSIVVYAIAIERDDNIDISTIVYAIIVHATTAVKCDDNDISIVVCTSAVNIGLPNAELP
jgi:hypothetical protein